ncbi:unnamed protein product, partial [Prorocentrum cordatum]
MPEAPEEPKAEDGPPEEAEADKASEAAPDEGAEGDDEGAASADAEEPGEAPGEAEGPGGEPAGEGAEPAEDGRRRRRGGRGRGRPGQGRGGRRAGGGRGGGEGEAARVERVEPVRRLGGGRRGVRRDPHPVEVAPATGRDEDGDEDWGDAGLGGGAAAAYVDPNSSLPGWQRLALEAYWSGDYWLAASYAEEVPRDRRGGDGRGEGKESDEYARCLSNRSGCFAKLGQHDISRKLALQLIELKPTWSRAWSRLGQACQQLGEEHEEEALSALSKASELDPCDANIDSLVKVVEAQMTAGSDEARKAKEKGVAAMVSKEFGAATVAFTIALALMPQVPDDQTKDGTSLLKAVLLADRAAAFTQLGRWESAIRDADVATVAKPSYARAFTRLGVALLGKARTEEAYFAFSRSLRLEHSKAAQAGLQECLTELMKWRSVAARKRHRRCFMDMRRPLGTTRIFAVSDVYFDNLQNEDWVFDIDDMYFQEDVLIVAGNLADSKLAISRGLTALRSKFRRVFYTVGNNEMRIHPAEDDKYPDSLAKLIEILQVCEELDVDTGPGAVCQGCFVVPLFSWFNAEFDEHDPWPVGGSAPAALLAPWPASAAAPPLWSWPVLRRKVARVSCQRSCVWLRRPPRRPPPFPSCSSSP